MRWNLDTARAILPEVRRLTEQAVVRVEALTGRRDGDLAPAEQVEVEQELARVVSVWIRGMEALGVDVKGAWLVDFDTGSGCYCWRWPEEQLEYFHGYDEGFAGRVRIQ
jgi:hypothetical protein